MLIDQHAIGFSLRKEFELGRGVSKTEKPNKLIQTNPNRSYWSIFKNKKGWFDLRILKIDLIDFFVS